MLFVPSNSHMEQPTKLLKNCTSKFTFNKQIKSHLLASKSQQCSKLSPDLSNVLIINANSSKLIIVVYMSPYLVLLILEFFPARLASLPHGLDSNITQLLANLLTKPSVFYYLLIVSCNLVSIKLLLLLQLLLYYYSISKFKIYMKPQSAVGQ